MTSSSWGSRAFVAAGVACVAGAVAGLVVLERRRRQRLALEVLEPDDDDGNDLVGAEAVTRPIIGGTDGDAKAGRGEGRRDGEAGTGGLEAGDEAAGVGPSASPPDDEADDEDDDDDGHVGSADLFLPPLSGEWAHVPDGAVLPAGMDVTMDMTTGLTWAGSGCLRAVRPMLIFVVFISLLAASDRRGDGAPSDCGAPLVSGGSRHLRS